MTGFLGLFGTDEFVNVTATDGSVKTGLQNIDGSYFIVQGVPSNAWRGAFHPCGALNVTVADGSKWAGDTAIDGSLNIFIGNGQPYGCTSVNDVTGGLSGFISVVSSDSFNIVSSDGSQVTTTH